MSRAKASMTSETWRCQPCQLRVSLWARPSSVFAVSNASSIGHRCPSTLTTVAATLTTIGDGDVKASRLAADQTAGPIDTIIADDAYDG